MSIGIRGFILAGLSLGFLLTACVATMPPPTLASQQRALQLIDQGVAELRAGELERSRASFEVSYQLNNSAPALDGLGAVAFLMTEYARAQRFYLAAIELDPEYAEAYANLGLLMLELNRERDAAFYLRTSIRLAPDNFRARNNLAALMLDAHIADGVYNLSEIKHELLKAYALSPNLLVQSNLSKLGEGDEKNS